ncbi:hypothetical protein BJP34_03630 [Moorena producens PAL-8-15-08-1]|uniref:Uncharacterized protein n=1 Tax=Moorena producens PAL-8-15-08-1 TaxID=1458985 RepID=A0A1D8TMM4_9CYAN|nr:hypothetical protein [Moorena producens]AOW98655.1 hypothetical protein BJP34_03630 [Moorena producens PAL-8-15-08-1]
MRSIDRMRLAFGHATRSLKANNAIASTKKRDWPLATLRERLNQKMDIAKYWDQYQWGGHPACLVILITGKMPVPR